MNNKPVVGPEAIDRLFVRDPVTANQEAMADSPIETVSVKIQASIDEGVGEVIIQSLQYLADGLYLHLHIDRDIALEMLRKHKKRKPLIPHLRGNDKVQYAMCPECKDTIYHTSNHCPECGQALDWSKE